MSGQERTIDPKAGIVDNRVTMDQPVGAIKATLGGYFRVEILVQTQAHSTWAVVYSGKEPMVWPFPRTR